MTHTQLQTAIDHIKAAVFILSDKRVDQTEAQRLMSVLTELGCLCQGVFLCSQCQEFQD